MSVDERIKAEDEALGRLIRVAGERAPLTGGFLGEPDGEGRAIRLPAPSRLLFDGRRLRSRRRLVVGSFAAAAGVVVAGAGAGVGTGAFSLPWVRAEGSVSPGTLYASSGTRVGDLVNAMDAMLPAGGKGWTIYSTGENRGYSETYRKAVDPETDESLRHIRWGDDDVYVPATTDRLISFSDGGDYSGPDSEVKLTLSRTEPGEPTAVLSTD